jgi:hypothetical protein
MPFNLDVLAPAKLKEYRSHLGICDDVMPLGEVDDIGAGPVTAVSSNGTSRNLEQWGVLAASRVTSKIPAKIDVIRPIHKYLHSRLNTWVTWC